MAEHRTQFNNRGITLVEIIVVIAILAIMAGGSVIGVGILSSGDANKASKTLESQLNALRANTLSIPGTWYGKIYLEDNTYKIDLMQVVTSGENTETKVVSSTQLGSRMELYYIEGSEITGTRTNVTDTNSIYITYVTGSGKIGSVTAGADVTNAMSIMGTGNLAGQLVLQASNSSEYVLKLWFETGRITVS